MSVTDKLWRFVGAIFIVAAATAVSFIMSALVLGTGLRSVGSMVAAIPVIAFFLSPVMAVLALCLGLPVVQLLYALGGRGWFAYGLTGALTGATLMAFVGLLFAEEFDRPSDLLMGLLGILPGLSGGLFWWGAVDRHRDRNPWRTL